MLARVTTTSAATPARLAVATTRSRSGVRLLKRVDLGKERPDFRSNTLRLYSRLRRRLGRRKGVRRRRGRSRLNSIGAISTPTRMTTTTNCAFYHLF